MKLMLDGNEYDSTGWREVPKPNGQVDWRFLVPVKGSTRVLRVLLEYSPAKLGESVNTESDEVHVVSLLWPLRELARVCDNEKEKLREHVASFLAELRKVIVNDLRHDGDPSNTPDLTGAVCDWLKEKGATPTQEQCEAFLEHIECGLGTHYCGENYGWRYATCAVKMMGIKYNTVTPRPVDWPRYVQRGMKDNRKTFGLTDTFDAGESLFIRYCEENGVSEERYLKDLSRDDTPCKGFLSFLNRFGYAAVHQGRRFPFALPVLKVDLELQELSTEDRKFSCELIDDKTQGMCKQCGWTHNKELTFWQNGDNKFTFNTGKKRRPGAVRVLEVLHKALENDKKYTVQGALEEAGCGQDLWHVFRKYPGTKDALTHRVNGNISLKVLPSGVQ